jgi:hypothetical protein
MRIRALLFAPVLAAMAVIGIGSSVASAAMLYTNSTHVTAVAVGTTAVATSDTVTLASGSTTVNSCTSSSLTLSLNGNSGGTVSANVTGGSFSGCRLFTTANTATPWRVVITGSGTTLGGNTIFANASIRAVSVTFAGGNYTGDLTSGVTAQQPVSGEPVSISLSNASRLAGPLTSNGQVTGAYTLTGVASAYSLG